MTATVTLRTPADVAAAVPGLIGFNPTESLVVVGVSGPSARVDLSPGGAEAIAEGLAPHRNPCVVRVYTDGDPEPWLTDAIVTMTAAGVNVAGPGLHVKGSTVSGGGGSWDFDPRDSELSALLVSRGQVTASSREELAASVAYDGRSIPCLPDLDDDDTRDGWLKEIHQSRAQLEFYRSVLAQTADDHPYVGHVAALAACSAYINGNGALAWCCLDRAERTTLGTLVEQMIEHAVPPTEFLKAFGAGS